MLEHGKSPKDLETLLHQDQYTVDELSKLSGIGVYVIQRAAREGDLKAYIVDHHIISIQREDALAWLNRPGGVHG